MAEQHETDEILNAIHSGWPRVANELQERINALTMQLISSNDEQIRGRIKALTELLEWPEQLRAISAGLSQADPAD